jgi:hypothetical protein
MFLAASGAALVAFAIYWIRGIGFLHERHPHEDAYILFRYVEHLVDGRGIVFNPDGPPTEGATDFLWMILLSFGVWLGEDVARAAVWLNALGCALMAYVIARVWLSAARTGVLSYVAPLVFAACLPWLPSAHAGYDGFSVQLYCGQVVLLYWLWLQGTARSLALVPYVALAIALFRPDGVLLGGGFYAIAVLTSVRDRHALRALLIHGAIAVVLGGLYFGWRAWYFGELLPLPLYVKSRGGSGAVGLGTNLRWLESAHGPVRLLVCAGAFGVVLIATLRWRALRSVLALVPAGLLFGALSFAHQTQNVDWRFQAPIYALVMVVMLRLGAGVVELADLGPRWRPRAEASPQFAGALGVLRALLVVAVVLACLLGLQPALARGKQIFPRDYMDTFAVHAGPTLDDAVIVLTEAGRLAYWTSGNVFDMVGLNLAETARKPPTLEYIDSLDPDVIMFHAAGTMDLARLMVHGTQLRSVHQEDPERKRVVRIEPASLPDALRGPFRAMRKSLPVAYAPGIDTKVKTASVILAVYLGEHANEFEVYVLPYGDSHNHVFGVRVGRTAIADFQEVLARGAELPYEPYAQVRRWPRSTACGVASRVAYLWGRGSSACGW